MNVLITGATHGIGRATAIALAKQGYKCFLLCRNKGLGEELCDEIKMIPNAPLPQLLVADLGKPEQIENAARSLIDSGENLHVLINNAAVVNLKRKTVSINGSEQEEMFAVNHLGHFLLTVRLLPLLIATSEQCGHASRLVIVSSDAHALFCKGIDFDDVTAEKQYSVFPRYGASKLANLLMMHELVKKVNSKKVQINALHPGAVRTNIGSNGSWYAPIIKGLLAPFFISAKKGSATILHLATQAIETQGAYYICCKEKPHRLKGWATDDLAAKTLWQYSCKALGLNPDTLSIG